MNAPEKIYITIGSACGLENKNAGRGVILKKQLSESDVEYIRSDLAMVWVPVAEADLQDGECVDLIQIEPMFHRTKCIYRASQLAFELPNAIGVYLGCSMVSHIMRVKMPGEAGK